MTGATLAVHRTSPASATAQTRNGANALRSHARLVAAGLPIPSATTAAVMAQIAGFTIVPGPVADRVSRCPASSARVLSAAPGSGDTVEIASAVHSLGADGLRRVISGGATHSLFDPTPGAAGMSPLSFSLTSAEVGEVAGRLVGHLAPEGDPLRARHAAHTAGVLHDIGAAVVLAMVEAAAGGPFVPRLGDHPAVGSWLAHDWGLDETVALAIRNHEGRSCPDDPIGRAVWLAVRVVDARRGHVPGGDLAAAGRSCGLDPDLLAQVALGTEPVDAGDRDLLTDREHEILCLLAQGMVAKQIARSLGCSSSTVHNHLHHAYSKLGVANQSQALLSARDRGWI